MEKTGYDLELFEIGYFDLNSELKRIKAHTNLEEEWSKAETTNIKTTEYKKTKPFNGNNAGMIEGMSSLLIKPWEPS